MKTHIPKMPKERLDFFAKFKMLDENFDLAERIVNMSQENTSQTPTQTSGLRRYSVGLYFQKHKIELFVEINQLTKIGRSYPQIYDYDGIDLSAFDAYMLGVSRDHAFFKYMRGTLVLVDNSSANGTQLNAQLLEPMIPYAIEAGDTIQLGTLEFIVTEL